MNEAQRQWYLQSMGIDVWVPRENISEATTTQADIATPELIQPLNQDTLATWQALQQKVAACQACGLHKTRTQTVFGVGSYQADLLIVGEAPGANEDAQGEPFVGRAGKLLDSMLFSIGLHRNKVFIANILKCRPPNNRDPKPEEVTLCTPFLEQQMQLLQPKLIVAVGRIAAHFLLKTNTALGRLRNRMHYYGSDKIPLMVTYHPAYLLRSPREKRKAYDDWLQIQELIQK